MTSHTSATDSSRATTEVAGAYPLTRTQLSRLAGQLMATRWQRWRSSPKPTGGVVPPQPHLATVSEPAVPGKDFRHIPECSCRERLEAERQGRIRYARALGGWIFDDVPLRQMSEATKRSVYRARRDWAHPDMSGWPMVFTICPYCGGELPGVTSAVEGPA